MKNTIVVKSTGDKEFFDPEKLVSSLKKSGAEPNVINQILQDIESWLFTGISTKEIYKKAFSLLKKSKYSSAARYSLKKAIMELGPSGFPFEQFIGALLRYQGFDVKVGQTVEGQCITHEVDVIATSNNKQYLVECKFYNTQGKFANVHVPLYIHSRVNDIIRKRSGLPEFKDLNFYGWIVTNTRFTSDAEAYGKCAGLQLMSWDFPAGHSLKNMVEKNGFYPITALSSLEKFHKQLLISREIVLCRQIVESPKVLDITGMKPNKIKKVLEEATELCEI
ncbi:hypothetical protein MASR1M45_20070 [Candidatus Kapaibacterium sp.]